ncbi:unnamed protein product [Trifolium pratense]|uniref:Uncharacterized protein n=1 Tax=Trifolium pratense TaxID=57577 RepID=A0ACB0IB11_TRIPR|nr:unnamed protein product [Trifolium pratense]
MTEENKFLYTPIPQFDGYYEHWAMLMENLIRSKELWSLIENGVTLTPANATVEQQQAAEANKLKDLKVKNYLFQSIERSIIETILIRETTKDIWDAMRRKYQGSTKVKRAHLQALRREFEVLEMKETETVNQYFARTLAIANRMLAQGETLQELQVVEKILRSMPARFNYVVCSIEESNDVTTMSIDALQSSLIVQESRMKRQVESGEEQALKVSNPGIGFGRGRGRGRGRQTKEFVECFKCHKFGHYQNECSELEDSGCSNHMIGHKEWFFDFDNNYRDSVKMGDDSRMAVMGKECIVINPMCLITAKQESTQLWHGRYGHLSDKRLNTLSKKQMVKGLPDFKKKGKGKSSWANGFKSKIDDKPESSKGGGFVKNQNKKKKSFDKSKPNSNTDTCLKGWCNSDYVGNLDDGKSTTGQENASAVSYACQGIWLKNVWSYLKLKPSGCIVIYWIIAPPSSFLRTLSCMEDVRGVTSLESSLRMEQLNLCTVEVMIS